MSDVKEVFDNWWNSLIGNNQVAPDQGAPEISYPIVSDSGEIFTPPHKPTTDELFEKAINNSGFDAWS